MTTSSFHPTAWILGEPEIGDHTWIGAFTLIDAKHAPLKIGIGCNISTGSQILTHSTVRRCVSEGALPIDIAATVVEDHVFIGSNAVILMGCTIGHHSVIAAGCVVKENTVIPPYSIVTGVPGKITGSSKKYL